MRKILLVDDEPLVVVTLKSLLDWNSFNLDIVMTCSNGEEALCYLEHHKDEIDIILSDVDMPKMDGIELGREIRRRNMNIAIVFLSAYSNFNYVREAFHNGACDYLLKSELDENKIIEVLTSNSLVKDKIKNSSKDNSQIDRISYIKSCLDENSVDTVCYSNCNFKQGFPFNLLLIRINEIDKIKQRQEIKTILEQENLDTISIDWQHYVMLIPTTYNLDKLIRKIGSSLWNYMDLSFEYKLSNLIENDTIFKNSLRILYNSFHTYSRLVTVSRKYILGNYKNYELNLTQIAKEVGVSKNHLSREYSKETGETLIEYISKIRITEAKKLLNQSNLKVYEISELIGFSNSETFFRTFKKVTGETPKNFQKK